MGAPFTVGYTGLFGPRLTNSTYDPDANAYFAARPSITSASQKSAINTFVLGLKADGLWNGMTDILLLCCGAFSDTLVKLKGSGTVTNSNFVSGDFNGTGANVGLLGNPSSSTSLNTGTPNSALTQSNFHLGLYITATTTTQATDLTFGRSGENILAIFSFFSGASWGFGGAQFASIGAVSDKGTWITSRTSADLLNLYVNGFSIQNNTNNDTGVPQHPAETGRIYGNLNNAGNAVENLSDRRIAAYFAGPGLNITQTDLLGGRFNQLFSNLASGPWPVVGPYVAMTFNEFGQSPFMAQSTDGVTFTLLPCTLIPSVGTVRDPALRLINSKWFAAYTSCGFTGGTSFGIASCDVGTGAFTTIANVDCSAASPTSVWSPTPFTYNGDRYFGISLTSNPDFASDYVQFYVKALNAALTSFTAPVAFGTTGFPGNTIAGFVFQNPNDGLWYMQATNEATPGLFLARSANPLTGWTVWKDTTAHVGASYEGGFMQYKGGTTWWEYADKLDASGMAVRVSTDDMATFGSWTHLPSTPIIRNCIMITG
jgi:hypothetical protein